MPTSSVDLTQLQQIEQQSLADMNAITINQIGFNSQMNAAKATHQAANSGQVQ